MGGDLVRVMASSRGLGGMSTLAAVSQSLVSKPRLVVVSFWMSDGHGNTLIIMATEF